MAESKDVKDVRRQLSHQEQVDLAWRHREQQRRIEAGNGQGGKAELNPVQAGRGNDQTPKEGKGMAEEKKDNARIQDQNAAHELALTEAATRDIARVATELPRKEDAEFAKKVATPGKTVKKTPAKTGAKVKARSAKSKPVPATPPAEPKAPPPPPPTKQPPPVPPKPERPRDDRGSRGLYLGVIIAVLILGAATVGAYYLGYRSDQAPAVTGLTADQARQVTSIPGLTKSVQDLANVVQDLVKIQVKGDQQVGELIAIVSAYNDRLAALEKSAQTAGLTEPQIRQIVADTVAASMASQLSQIRKELASQSGGYDSAAAERINALQKELDALKAAQSAPAPPAAPDQSTTTGDGSPPINIYNTNINNAGGSQSVGGAKTPAPSTQSQIKASGGELLAALLIGGAIACVLSDGCKADTAGKIDHFVGAPPKPGRDYQPPTAPSVTGQPVTDAECQAWGRHNGPAPLGFEVTGGGRSGSGAYLLVKMQAAQDRGGKLCIAVYQTRFFQGTRGADPRGLDFLPCQPIVGGFSCPVPSSFNYANVLNARGWGLIECPSSYRGEYVTVRNLAGGNSFTCEWDSSRGVYKGGILIDP